MSKASTSPANLQHLPIEVLLQITAHLTSLRDVSSLSCSHPRINESLDPELYAVDAKSLRSRALFWASLYGSCKVARKALQAGTDVDTYCENSHCKRDWESRERHYGKDATPLLIAATYGHVDLVSLLLENGADQRWTDYEDTTALSLACRHGHADIVRLLLSKSTADINFPTRELQTPLILATCSDHLNVVQVLLQQDEIDLDATDNSGTALFHAGVNGRVEIFDAIHDRGASIFGIARVQHLPDFGAVCGLKVPRSLAIAEEMLALGADANAASETGRTPLMSACEAGNVNVAKMLLSRNVEILAVDANGKTALHFACGLEDPELAELLISRGLAPLTGSGSSRTLPLHFAAITGGYDVVKLLLGKGADPILLDESHQTAFERASARGDSGVLSLLLTHCANRKLGDIINAALMAACRYLRIKNAKILLEAGADPNYVSPQNPRDPLYVTCSRHFRTRIEESEPSSLEPLEPVEPGEPFELAKALLDAGADANGVQVDVHTDFMYYTGRPLYSACQGGFERVVELLLSRGADPNLGSGNLLDSIGKSGNPNILKLLISRGLIPKDDDYGRMALQSACVASREAGAAEVVDIFLQYGIDPREETGDEYDTALSWACSFGNSEIVKVLLSRGVDCNQRFGVRHATPLAIACTRGNLEIAQILIEHGAEPSGLKSKPSSLMEYSINYYATDFGVLQLLLSLGWDSVGLKPDSTAISNVSDTGDLRAFRELISRGADPFVLDSEGQSILHKACKNDERTRRCIEYLLDLGLDPNAKEPLTGYTALHRAARVRSLSHVKTLVEYGGADLHSRDNNGRTALYYALERKDKAICDYITAKSAEQGTA